MTQPIISLDQTKAWLRIADSTRDRVLNELRAACTREVISYLNWDLIRKQRVSVIDGNQLDVWTCPEFNVTRIVAVECRTGIDAAWTPVSGSFELITETGGVFFPSRFLKGRRNYRITRISGWPMTLTADDIAAGGVETMPEDIVNGLRALVTLRFHGSNVEGARNMFGLVSRSDNAGGGRNQTLTAMWREDPEQVWKSLVASYRIRVM